MKLIRELNEEVEYLVEGNDSAKKFYISGIFLQGAIKNRNGRIYPMGILENAVERYRQEKLDRGQAVGELNHPCFSPSADVLTTTGWKNITEIKPNDKIFTLEPHTRQIQVKNVDAVHKNKFVGDMIRLSSRSINTLVTPYHKFPTYYRDGSAYYITAQEIYDGFEAKNAMMSHFSIPKNGTYNEASKIKAVEFESLNTQISLEIFAAFLALYLAEGSTYKRAGRENSYVVNITQNAGQKAEIIQALLDQTGFKWTREEHQRENLHYVWKTHNRELAEYLYPLGKAKDKYIPEEILEAMDAKSAEAFFEYYVLGDGRGQNKKYSTQDVFSISEKMIDGLSVVATKAGKSIRTFVETATKDYTFAGHMIRAENKQPLHFLRALRSKNFSLDRRFLSAEKEAYDGFVYCLSVENQTFLARDNGYAFWSGNCGPSINLDRVSHKIISLTKEGTNYIGKAELITTNEPGRIARNLLEAGVRIGVSSRGLGSVRPNRQGINEVQDDFFLATAADIVADPSAPDAFVNGVMEGVEWIWNSKGDLIQQTVEEIAEQAKRQRLSEHQKIKAFEKFIRLLGK